MVMGIDAILTESGDRLPEIKALLDELRDTEVLVGIPSDKTDRDKTGINNVELLYIHTHGVRAKSMRDKMQPELNKGTLYSKAYELYIHEYGSPIWHVPPRPVLEPAVDRVRGDIAQYFGDALAAALDGKKGKAHQLIAKAGMHAVNKAHAWFTDPANNWPPNSPKTVELKGSSRPLIDTGQLRKSITYVIAKRGDSR